MKGKISITRICTNQIGRNNNIVMRIENDKADVVFDLEITPEKLGLALTGLAFQDCEITAYGEVRENDNCVDEVREETIKEFAERLKKSVEEVKPKNYENFIYLINNLVKEMAGD